MMDTVTTTAFYGFWIGSRIAMAGDPNSLRRMVTSVLSSTQYDVLTVRRPSKGFRRHLRRAKARGQRGS